MATVGEGHQEEYFRAYEKYIDSIFFYILMYGEVEDVTEEDIKEKINLP